MKIFAMLVVPLAVVERNTFNCQLNDTRNCLQLGNMNEINCRIRSEHLSV